MRLKKYLNNSRNSLIREKLANYRLFYEIKLASAKSEIDVKISLPEVDNEGYDLVLGDGDAIVPIQVKTTLSDSTTSRWQVQKYLLRPDRYYAEILGFESSPFGLGLQGGLLLLEIVLERNDIKEFVYYYCDVFVLKAFECGLIQHHNRTYKDSISNVFNSLKKGDRFTKVSLTKSCLVRMSNVEKILAFVDFANKSSNLWRTSFIEFIKNNNPENDRPRMAHLTRQLISDKRLIIE